MESKLKQPGETLKFWLDVFVGRMFFRLGARDDWQKILIITGQGATGKSTIAKALQRCVGERNVGNIPSNCEAQWALANIQSKTMWMCTEMKANFRLDMSVMQNMVSGDPVTIHQKFKDAVDVPTWMTHGFLVGNEFPTAWLSDAGGALTRRAAPFRFNKAGDGKPSIQTDFYNNLAPFLVRTTRAYLTAAGKYKGNLDLPEELERYQKEFQITTTPFFQFLNDTSFGYDFNDDVAKQTWEILYYLYKPQLVRDHEFDAKTCVRSTYTDESAVVSPSAAAVPASPSASTSSDNEEVSPLSSPPSPPSPPLAKTVYKGVFRFNTDLDKIPLTRKYLADRLTNSTCNRVVRTDGKDKMVYIRFLNDYLDDDERSKGRNEAQRKQDEDEREVRAANWRGYAEQVSALQANYDLWRKAQTKPQSIPQLDTATLATLCKQNNWLIQPATLTLPDGKGDEIIGLRRKGRA